MASKRKAQTQEDEEKEENNKEEDILEEEEEDGDEDDEDEDDEDEDEDENADEDTSEDEITVDFELDSPKPLDFHSLKNLLKHYLGYHSSSLFNPSQLVDILLSQSDITRVIRVDGNEDTDDQSFGFISVFNYHQYRNLECVQQIKGYVLQKAGEKKDSFKQAFDQASAHSLGIILNERMINVPPELAFPLNRLLFENINEASANNKGKDDTFNFEKYLILTSFQKQTEKKKKDNKNKKSKSEADEIIYTKAEDEIWRKEAEFVFTFPINRDERTSRWTLNGIMSTVGLGLIVNKNKVPKVLQQLEELFK